MKKIIFTCLILLTPWAAAEQVPEPGTYDERLRSVIYNPAQVYRISARVGYASYIQFWEDEKLESFFTGDQQGWDVGAHNSLIAFKPVVENPTTNFVILTNKGRVYNLIFDLNQSSDHIVGLKFRYPEEEKAKILEEREAANKKQEKADKKKRAEWRRNKIALEQDQARQRQVALQKKEDEHTTFLNHLERKTQLLALKEKQLTLKTQQELAEYNRRQRQRQEAAALKKIRLEEKARIEAEKAKKRLDWEKRKKAMAEEQALKKEKMKLNPLLQTYKDYAYYAAGDESGMDLMPVEMFDNGQFTFLHFPPGKAWPTVFRMRKGKAYMVNVIVQDDWMVIPRTSEAWRLRLDDDYLCIQKLSGQTGNRYVQR